MGKPRSILFVQTAFIGDAILATAMIESWHAAHPKDHLHLVVRSGNKSLFQGHPFLSGLHVWEKSKNPFGRYRNLVTLGLELRGIGFDVLVTPHRHASSGILALLSGAQTCSGFSSHPMSWLFAHSEEHAWGNGEHEIERNHRLLAPWVESEAPRNPKLYPPNNVGVSEAEGEFGIAAPASQWATKKWPLDRWIAWLDAEAIQSPDRRIVLIGGPADVEELREIARQSSHDRLEIRTDLSLLESAGWMKAARWVVTNDSGPMHMASAVNAPTVAIFCSTVPSFGFGPLSSLSVVVEKKEELVCRPCGMHGKRACPLGHFQCGTGIAVDHVLAAVARF